MAAYDSAVIQGYLAIVDNSPTNAAKGIQAVPGRDLLVGDTPVEFANHVIALLQRTDLRRTLSHAGRKQVEQAHLWPTAMTTLDELLAQHLEDSTFARLKRSTPSAAVHQLI